MNVAFIPVRGGSKSIPLKNIKEINGKPLVYWVTKAACQCESIDCVYVATDSIKIKEVLESIKKSEGDVFSKLEVIDRSEESAQDTASTEFAMLEFADKYEFENIVLIQATSPLLKSSDLDNGFAEFDKDDVDSIISVVKQKRFIWNFTQSGFVKPSNYDVFNRPRRQEFDGYLVENGAFYITSKKALIETQNRISGNIKPVIMEEDSFFEIDEPSDWLIIESLMKNNNKINYQSIKMFLTDCDGCLTDGGMYYSEFGDELKKFNTRDGMGFSMLKDKGILVGIITSENVKLNFNRAQKLGLDILEVGCKDKAEVIKKLCEKYQINLDEVVYIGDDINDLEALKLVGLSCCPNDAVEKVKNVCDVIANAKGGNGVIREIADLII